MHAAMAHHRVTTRWEVRGRSIIFGRIAAKVVRRLGGRLWKLVDAVGPGSWTSTE
jgi:hypothetical protein